MLKDQRFWVGAAVGAGVAYYFFVVRTKKMAGAQRKQQQSG